MWVLWTWQTPSCSFFYQFYKNQCSFFNCAFWCLGNPSRTVTLTGHKWFVTFIDNFSRTTWVYLLKEKKMCHVFQIFNKMIRTQFGTEIKILRSDNGKEYDNSGLSPYLASNGIIHQTSCVDTPQQNGVAERKNCHLLDVARSMLFSMNVLKTY